MNVDAGTLFNYGKLEIRGLDVLSEPAIRKMWGEREGKPFDAGYPDAFLKQVKDQGIFDNLGETSSQTKINEDAKTVDVTLIFLGQSLPTPAGKNWARSLDSVRATLQLGGNMRFAKAFGLFMLAAVVAGVIANRSDIRRYIRISTM